ncbi:hypothetical protein MES5069_450041 [Mesorhizobium escarrei]|uniref:Uncharacterized protein n=1 Tax=Mesorhizobium escarrei TaxID=666018 RepID=A0ABN8K460_9HYPH|nr:hypothetical protein MES5069_450041 [Mesorhizobium escarrei]
MPFVGYAGSTSQPSEVQRLIGLQGGRYHQLVAVTSKSGPPDNKIWSRKPEKAVQHQATLSVT